jgi:lipoprotein-anchoring transpeptidase ErfK/SrfK
MRRPASLLLTCLAVLVFVAGGCAGSRPSLDGITPPTTTGVPDPGAKVATLDPNAAGVSVVATASVATVNVYDAPDAAKPNRSLKSPNVNGVPVVFLVDATQDGWLRVLLPVRPNGSTGWIRSSDVTLSRHNYHIEVRLSEFRIKVTQGDDVILETSIGVAKDNTPTPGGRYYTTELLRPPSPNTVYGTYAYGLSGFSETFETFNGGPGQLGIHGTNDPTSIGQKVSSGCVRLRNEDIDKLAAILPLGVPVQIIK